MAAEVLIRTEFDGIVVEGTMCCGGAPYADTFTLSTPDTGVIRRMTANQFQQFVRILAATDINAIHRPK